MRTVRFLIFLLVIIAVLALSGCFIFGRGPLEIISISPQVEADDVPIDAVFSIEASAELEPGTVTVDSVQLLKGGTAVPADVTVTGQSISLTPDELLDFGTDYTLVIAGTVADTRGNSLEGEVSGAFTTRHLTVNVTSTGGWSLPGAEVTVDGSTAGSTGSAGELSLSVSSGGTIDVAATKTFFMDSATQAVPLDGSIYEAEIGLSPYIYIGSRPEGAEIVQLSSVDAVPESFVYLNSIYHGEVDPYSVSDPGAIYTDYENGLMYILDSKWVGDPLYTEVTVVIRLTNFPPATDGSEATVSELYTLDPPEVVRNGQQLAVLGDGSVMLFDSDHSEPGDFRLVHLPQSLDFAGAQFGTLFAAPDPPDFDAMGLSQLPNGSFLVTGGDHATMFAVTLSGVDDTTTEDFGSFAYGTGVNELAYPTRTMVSPDGSHVYISDTGYRFTPPPNNNSRVVRVNADGSGFAQYGTLDTGTHGEGEFDNPIILGLLPDNKLYIMDVDNDRLVRIDPGVFDGGSADWRESDAGAGFNFDYWYNYS